MIFSSSWTIFKKSLLILFTILLLFFMFWVFGWVSCRILASCQGIKPAAPVLESRVLTTRPLAVAILPISHVQLFATPWTAEHQASLLFTISQSFLKLMSIELVMPPSHLILCHSLLLSSILPSIRVFSSESAFHIRWPKYWSFSFNISPSNVYSGLISFRIDWFDLLTVQGTLKSLLQHHSLKESVLWSSGFFMIQLSHPYMTTGKTIALTIHIFAGKVMSLLFNMLSKFVITFLSRSKHLLILWLHLLILWLQWILEPKKIKSFIVSPSICHEVMGPDVMILVFWMLSFKPAFSLFYHQGSL